MFGRPSSSTPTLGSSSQRSQSTAMKQAQVSNRQRRMYSMLAGGVSNRLLLSLRSGIPKEVDYALDLFVQYSYTDAAVIPLDALPGLPLALLELVRPSPARDNETIRRRTEAALVLRNFVLEGGPRCIETVRPFVDTVFEVLVEVIEADAERSTELVLYMLDLAEVYASTCRLLPSDFDAPLENQLPAQKLYSLLAQIAQINDRALIIAAYTLLSALAMNPNNAPVFASQATLRKSHAAHPDCPPTNLVKRAIALLPLKDNEILLPVLEFLYQHTLNPVNAARLLQTQNMRQIIRAVVSHIQEGAREEQVEYEVLEGSGHGHNHRGKAMREALIEAYPSLNSQQASSASPSSPPEPLMDPEDLQAILFLPEPQRAHAWMKEVFEADIAGEVTQVSVWQAYQKQFEPFDDRIKGGEIPAMLGASDVIKGTQDVFITSSPKHIDTPDGGKRFVISGIKVRDLQAIKAKKAKEQEMWRCRWTTCELAQPLNNAAQLYHHLETAHVHQLPGAQMCQINGCGQYGETPRQLQFHLRTHIPSPIPASRDAPPILAHAADALDHMTTFFIEQRQVPQTTHGEFAAGIGFVASLVVRNCARATANAAQRYLKLVGHSSTSRNNGAVSEKGKSAALDNEEDDVERRKMFGFLTGSTAEGEGEEKEADSAIDVQLTAEQLQAAVNALAVVEMDLIAVTAANKALAGYLTEALQSIEDAKRSLDGVL